MNRNTIEMLNRLHQLGIDFDDGLALRRISMTLRRWYELECGTERGSIFREAACDKPVFTHYSGQQWPVADRERGALKRLDALMARYPDLAAYVQNDPRGAALYIYRKGSEQLKSAKYGIDSVYSSIGMAVYK